MTNKYNKNMIPKNEKKMYQHFSRFFRKIKDEVVIIQRLENMLGVGLPDVIMFYKSLTVFVELKTGVKFEPSQIALFNKVESSHLFFVWSIQKGFFMVGKDLNRFEKVFVRKKQSPFKYTHKNKLEPKIPMIKIGEDLAEFKNTLDLIHESRLNQS